MTSSRTALRLSRQTPRRRVAHAGIILRPGHGQMASTAATKPRSRNISEHCSSTFLCSIPALVAAPRPLRSVNWVTYLLAWENEAYLSLAEFGADKFDIVVPPQSILAEPPGCRRRRECRCQRDTQSGGSLSCNTSILKRARHLAAKHFYRPSEPELVSRRSPQKTTRVETGDDR